ncbi:MAG: hypothetical protein RMJ55_02020 [Roseiflexaceae bacterium]|nr:hypothetical protein [Roseiflexaceae bacterium]
MTSHRMHDSPERAATLNRRLAAEAAQREAAAEPAPHPLVALQRQVGNAQVARMLATRAGEEEEMQAKHDVAMRAGEDEEEMQEHDLAIRHVGAGSVLRPPGETLPDLAMRDCRGGACSARPVR